MTISVIQRAFVGVEQQNKIYSASMMLNGRDSWFRQSALVAMESSLAALQGPKRMTQWNRCLFPRPMWNVTLDRA